MIRQTSVEYRLDHAVKSNVQKAILKAFKMRTDDEEQTENYLTSPNFFTKLGQCNIPQKTVLGMTMEMILISIL